MQTDIGMVLLDVGVTQATIESLEGKETTASVSWCRTVNVRSRNACRGFSCHVHNHG